ncbi:TetR family transcriptional regulator [Actinocorallia herbida]|uniref:TetR family transcriptional regulator n=1 Tax=Actinocorallia herbida TaxID=58109 RepID=A0A3N1D3A1_9ACTN|nr:TetR/AcrR family transcriptional regulator [Actinocorallia herbida]ROO87980.1 TetR family transcriptional regulator [Actinocorallia herbida]
MQRPTRAQLNEGIVSTAARLFARQGYEATKLQQIAEEMGYSKAALLYHFKSKESLLVAAMEPPALAAEELLEDLEGLSAGPERDITVITRLLDLALEHRERLILFLSLAGSLGGAPEAERFAESADRVQALLVPPGAPFERRVQAAQMEGGMLAAVLKFTDVDIAELREPLLRGALRCMGLACAPESGA